MFNFHFFIAFEKSIRFLMALPKVNSSIYSISPPIDMPRAIAEKNITNSHLSTY